MQPFLGSCRLCWKPFWNSLAQKNTTSQHYRQDVSEPMLKLAAWMTSMQALQQPSGLLSGVCFTCLLMKKTKVHRSVLQCFCSLESLTNSWGSRHSDPRCHSQSCCVLHLADRSWSFAVPRALKWHTELSVLSLADADPIHLRAKLALRRRWMSTSGDAEVSTLNGPCYSTCLQTFLRGISPHWII